MTSILDPAPIDEQAVRAIHALWIEAVNAGDVERLLSLMSSDALFLSPGRPPLGAQAFPAQFASAHEEFRIRCVSELAELVVAGDLAYTLCHDALWLTPRTGGATTELAGQRITLYRRQRDGRWLLARDAHTLLPPTR